MRLEGFEPPLSQIRSLRLYPVSYRRTVRHAGFLCGLLLLQLCGLRLTFLGVLYRPAEVHHRSPQTPNRPLLMGHSSLAVLHRYLALAGEDIERAHRLHSPVDNLL